MELLKKLLIILLFVPLFASADFTVGWRATSTTQGTILPNKILNVEQALGLLSTATSTATNGFNISGGCFAVNNVCVGGSTYSASWPITLSGSTFGFDGLATSSPWTSGQLSYVVNGQRVSSVATTTVSCSGNTTCTGFVAIGSSPITISSTGGGTGLSTTSPIADSNVLVYSSAGAGAAYGVATGTVSSSGGITTTAGRSVLGGALSIVCDVASSLIPGCLSAADWTTFNNKVSSSSLVTYVGSTKDWQIVNSALTPTTTIGIIVSASSTIGDGNAAGGLVINGNATTTGGQYIAGNVCIGTENCSGAELTISSAASFRAPISNATIHVIGTNNMPVRAVFDTNNAATNFGSLIQGRRSRGPAASPSAVTGGDVLLQLAGAGYGSTDYVSSNGSKGIIAIKGDATWTDTNSPTRIEFFTVPNNSVTNALNFTIASSGAWGIGGTASQVISDADFGDAEEVFVSNGATTRPKWTSSLFLTSASTTRLSALQAWFGATATTSIASDGQLNSQNIVVANNKTIQFAGYSASPQLYAGDSTTGLHFDGPGIVSVHGTGRQEAILTSTNRWGFGGTTSPYAKFTIHAYPHETNNTLFVIASSTDNSTTTLFSISNTGTTTAANGFNITAGCFAVNNVCVGSGTVTGSGTAGQVTYWTGTGSVGGVATTTLTLSSFPANLSGTLGKLIGGTDSTWTYWGLATTSQPSSSNLLVSDGANGVFGVATSTLTAGSGLTGSFTQIGSGGSVACLTASATQAGCLGTSDFQTFNNKIGTSTSETAGYVPFASTNSATPALLSFDSGFFWDNTNKRLGIGTTSPYAMLSVAGQIVGGYFTGTTTATSSVAGPFNFGLANTTSTIAGQLSITGTGTSTASGGFNLTAGCFAINNVCVGGGSGITGSGNSNEVTFWNAGGSTIQSTPLFVWTNNKLSVGSTSPTTGLFGALNIEASTTPQIIFSDNNQTGSNKYYYASTSLGSLVFGSMTEAGVRTGRFSISSTGGLANSWGSTLTTFLTNDGRHIAKDGTAASPGYTFASSATTGLFNSGGSSGSINFSTSGGEKMTLTNAGNFGLATTSPWANFSITGSSTAPIFHIATSTANPLSNIFSIFATSSVLIGSSSPESGARVAIGDYWQYASGTPNAMPLDQLYIDGRINTGEWQYSQCIPGGTLTATADSTNICGAEFAYMIDASGGQFQTLVGTNSGMPYIALVQTSGATANNGAGIFNSQVNWLKAATNTPIIETMAALNGAATNTAYYFGFTNVNPAGTSFEVAPTAGCFLTASTTKANWILVSATTTQTNTDTGLASTTRITTWSQPQYLRVEMDGKRCTAYVKTAASSTLIKKEIPYNQTTTSLTPGFHYGYVTAATNNTMGIRYSFLRNWFRFPFTSFQY